MRIHRFHASVRRAATRSSWYGRKGSLKRSVNVLGHILSVLSVCLGFANASSAQDGWGAYGSVYGYYDPMATMQIFSAQQEQFSQQMMDMLNQKNAELIAKYRHVTGDYSSSDQEAQARLTSMSQQAYPEAWAKLHQNQLQHNQQMFQSTQNMLSQHANDIRQINQSSNRYYDQTMDGLNQKYSNYMREQSPWVNPDTGEVSTLPYGTPDTYYQGYGDGADPYYYQNSDGQYYQYDTSGFATQLQPYYP